MASYIGNLGLVELVLFYKQAHANNDIAVVALVNRLIDENSCDSNYRAWKIVQAYTGTSLIGK